MYIIGLECRSLGDMITRNVLIMYLLGSMEVKAVLIG